MNKKPTATLTPQTSVPIPPLPLPGLKPIRAAKEICRDFARGSAREWVIVNGIGGYASSTISGMNTRRYHGLLVAALRPPVGRIVTLSKVEETLATPSARHELSTNQYGGVVHPEGYRYLVEFRLDPWPTFLYQIGELLLEKSVFLLPGENAVVVGYRLHAGPGPVELAVRPLVAMRDFRWVSEENDTFKGKVEQGSGSITVRPYEALPPLVIHHTAELVEVSPCWYRSFEYLQEERTNGTRAREDLWSPGLLRYLLRVGESCALVASTGRKGMAELAFHQRRVENTQTVQAQTTRPPGDGPLAARLGWTADSFIAHAPAPERGTFLVAGFPWFAPWGRDALIALPGLTLVPKRFDLAREILETLARQVKDGLIPVRVGEEDGLPEYDSADTSLWFFWAVWHYWKATRDIKFIAKKLLDPMREILEHYLEGTLFGIGMDEDGLILLPDEELPLTWMDARLPSANAQVPGKAVTPRSGKPVEVNALWYCALNIMAVIGERLGLKRTSTYVRLSRLVQQNFVKNFSNPQGFLVDRIGHGQEDFSIRPNMLIAAGLPFSPVPKMHAARILDVVEKELLTPLGVRSLSPQDPRYRGRYAGDLKDRAQAYHQGTGWAWLLGPYVSTVAKVRRLTSATQQHIRRQLEPFVSHLEEGTLGSVCEIFDGDPPHAPRGGPSQAWSVGELLRALHEAKLTDL